MESIIIIGILLITFYSSVLNHYEIKRMLSIISVFLYALIFLGYFLDWRGRQYAAKMIAESVLGDSKPDVLYLRPFERDSSTLRYMFSLFGRSLSRIVTIEEQLSEVLQPFGDLVAIGKPGDTLPPPGAARLYTSSGEWKKNVTDQMQSASIVVLRAGRSEGLLWELKQAVQILTPKKLLILTLKMKKKHYETFRQEAEQIFNGVFPKADEIRLFGRISGFFIFSKGWVPKFIPLRIPYFKRSPYKPYQRIFKYTLRPIFEKFGLEWESPPVSRLTVLKIVLLVIFGLLILDLFLNLSRF